MTYTAEYLITRRKEKWNNTHDLEYDKQFREAVVNELISDKKLLEEVQKEPNKLIELLFIVVDKEQKTIPFFLNEVQLDLVNRINKAREEFEKGIITDISILILKGRQQGFTTVVTAYQLASILITKNFQGFTVADESSNSETIFQNKAKFVYDALPDKIKPSEKYNNKRQFLFDKINSSWSVDTATKNMGRSRTINFFHGSECAFWKYGIAITQAGIGEAFTRNCIKIYESTANGFNEYRQMWKSEVHINCFYEWWRTPEYRIKFESEKVKKDFILKIKGKSEWIFERLSWLQNKKKLELEQLYWYYKKYNNYIDKELIKQEYPCTADEAFIASGRCIFDKENIIRRIDELSNKKTIKRGFFTYKYDGLKLEDIKWENDESGCIKIYELPKKMYPYCLAGDTAGTGEDFFTGQVIDNTNGKQVAVLKQDVDEDLYAKQMYCLGKYYNNALIGIETNFSTYPQKELEKLGYENFYIREIEDKYTHKLEKAYGFRTTTLTRPLILADLVKIVRDSIEYIVDIETLEEMLTFVKNKDGKSGAQEGYHDDLVMALAIVYYIRTQQKYTIDTDIVKKEIIKNFNIEKETYTTSTSDLGDNIVVI